MSAEISELQKNLANVMRVGRVTEVSHVAGRARVKFGDNTTALIPWVAGRAGAVKEWSPPGVGEQVVVLSPSGEPGQAVIMSGGINYNDMPAPGNAGNKYILVIPEDGGWTIQVGDSTLDLTNDSFKAFVGGKTLEVKDGKLTFDGDVEITGKISATQNIETPADVKAGSISLKTHVHPGIQPGGATTLPPSA